MTEYPPRHAETEPVSEDCAVDGNLQTADNALGPDRRRTSDDAHPADGDAHGHRYRVRQPIALNATDPKIGFRVIVGVPGAPGPVRRSRQPARITCE